MSGTVVKQIEINSKKPRIIENKIEKFCNTCLFLQLFPYENKNYCNLYKTEILNFNKNINCNVERIIVIEDLGNKNEQ